MRKCEILQPVLSTPTPDGGLIMKAEKAKKIQVHSEKNILILRDLSLESENHQGSR